MASLTSRKTRDIPSPDGQQAELVLIEENGEEYIVCCLCKPDGTTEISEVGDGQMLAYLNERYSPQTVCGVCRQATLREPTR